MRTAVTTCLLVYSPLEKVPPQVINVIDSSAVEETICSQGPVAAGTDW
jgi:hypothetical protein